MNIYAIPARSKKTIGNIGVSGTTIFCHSNIFQKRGMTHSVSISHNPRLEVATFESLAKVRARALGGQKENDHHPDNKECA